MFKQTALIFGLGLSLSLAACAPSETAVSDPVQETQSTPEITKPESRGNREGREVKRSGEGRREGRTPPEAAYAACASVALKESCTIETPRGTRTGVCRTRDGDDRAVCAVARPEGGRRLRR